MGGSDKKQTRERGGGEDWHMKAKYANSYDKMESKYEEV